MYCQKNSRYCIISVVLNFYSFFRLIPFHLRWNPTKNSFSAHSTYFHKLLCFLLHMFVLYPSLIHLGSRIYSIRENPGNILSVFTILENLAACALFCCMIFFFWRRQALILGFINDTYPFQVSVKTKQYLCFYVSIITYYLIIRRLGKQYKKAQDTGGYYADFAIELFGMSHELQFLRSFIQVFIICIHQVMSLFYMLHNGIIIAILLTIKAVWRVQKELFVFDTSTILKWGHVRMSKYVSQMNKLVAWPMLLLYFNNLAYFAEVIGVLSCKACGRGLTDLEQVVQKVGMMTYTACILFIWVYSSILHYEVNGSFLKVSKTYKYI